MRIPRLVFWAFATKMGDKGMRWVMFILLLSVPIFMAGQSKVSGKVIDSQGRGVDFASLVWVDESGKQLGFTYSRVDGFFEVVLPAETLRFCARMLGFEEWCVGVTNLPKDSLVIALKPSAQTIKEVTIKSKNLPIRERGDTISFSADSFRDSTERVVEDLLKKIPGIEISPSNGQITWYTKPIKSLLIEGSDVLGSQYTVGSKNLSADIVKSIEVIQDFSTNKVLSRLEKSRDVAINLKLKDPYLNKVTGDGEIMAGAIPEAKFGVNANVLNILTKVKSLLITNNSNIGKGYDFLDVAYLDESTSDLTQILQNNSIQMPVIVPIGVHSSNFDNAKKFFATLRNDFQIAGSNLLLNSSLYSRRDDQAFSSDLVSLLDPNFNRFNSESREVGQLFHKHELSYRTSSRDFHLDYQAGFAQLVQNGRNDLNRGFGDELWKVDDSKWGIHQQLAAFLPISDKIIAAFEAKYNNVSGEESGFSSIDFDAVDIRFSNPYRQDQEITQANLSGRLFLAFGLPKRLHKLGFTYRRSSFDSRLEQMAGTNPINQNLLLEDFLVQRVGLFYNFTLRIGDKFVSDFTADIQRISFPENKRFVRGLGSVHASYRLTKLFSLNLRGFQRPNIPSIRDLQTNTILEEPFVLKNQIFRDTLGTERKLELSVNFNNLYEALSSSIFWSFHQGMHRYIQGLGLQNDLMFVTPTLEPNHRSSILGFKFSKLFSQIRLNVSTRHQWTDGSSWVSVGGGLSQLRNTAFSHQLSFQYIVRRGIHLSTEGQLSNQIQSYDNLDFVSNRFLSFRQLNKLIWKLQKWDFQVEQTSLYLRNRASNTSGLHDLNLHVSYLIEPKEKSPFRIRFSAYNLLSSSALDQPSFLENFTLTQMQESLPFFFVAGFDFKF